MPSTLNDGGNLIQTKLYSGANLPIFIKRPNSMMNPLDFSGKTVW